MLKRIFKARFNRFLVVGGIATAVHLAIGLLLTGKALFPPFEANLIAFMCSLCISYLGQARYTFDSEISSPRQFKRFTFAAITTMLVGQAIVWVVITLGRPYTAALVLIVLVNLILSYLLQAKFVFKAEPKVAEVPTQSLSPFFNTVYLLLAGIVTVAIFKNIGQENLWLDEIFSYYFSGQQTGLSTAWARMVGDVHPPLFYLILHAIGQLPLAFETSARGLSFISALATLFLLFRASRPWLNLSSRTFTVGFAAVSGTWLHYAMEARSYALSQLIAMSLVLVVLRILGQHKSQKPISLNHWLLLILLSIIGGFAHYYLFIFAGAGFALLVLQANSWRHSARAVMAGLTVLAIIVPYILWHKEQMLVAEADTWFASNARFFLNATIDGLKSTLGSAAGALITVALGVTFVLTRKTATDDEPLFSPILISIALFWLLVPLLAIIVSLAFKPIYAPRLYAISLPLFWLALGFVFQRITEAHTKTRTEAYIGVTVSLLLLASAIHAVWQTTQRNREQWRGSAEYVASLPSCNAAAIPVLDFEVAYTADDSATIFYGHYLPEPRKLMPVSRDWEKQHAFPPQLLALWEKRAATEDACPILLWSVHHANRSDLETFVRQGHLAILPTLNEFEKELVIRAFPAHQNTGAYLVMIADKK